MKGMLKKLVDKRVVDFDLINKGEVIEIMEWCDEYFSVTLNKDEFGQLIDELKELHTKMVD